MIIVGLTGSIGMGKSTAAAMLRDMGIAVHDSDEVARAVLAPGGDAVDIVSSLFPSVYDRKTKTIDRAALATLVFEDPEKKAALEEIIHPLVRASQQDFLREQRRAGAKLVVLDIPLLFETGAEERVDYTIVVTAPAFLQRQRVLARPGMTEEKFEAILESQMPDGEKRHRADFIVQTGNGRAYSFQELKRIIGVLTDRPVPGAPKP